MRILLFFDLPTVTSSDRREYRKFRKFLLKNGFIMLQESVYSKLALNQTMSNNIVEKIKKNKPPSGLVSALVITEKQYSRMHLIIGDYKSDIINDDRRLVVL